MYTISYDNLTIVLRYCQSYDQLTTDVSYEERKNVRRVVSVLDSGAEGAGFKSQPRRCRVTVLGKLFTSIVPLFTKQQNW